MEKEKATQRITLENVRVGYVHVFEPSQIGGKGEPKYSLVVLIDKNDTRNISILQEALAVAQEIGVTKKWGGRMPAILEIPMKDGDGKDLDKNPEYAGKWYMNVSNTIKPLVVDRRRNILKDPADFYSGCYANVIVSLFAWSNVGKNGVSASLLGCQFVSDGERLSSSSASVNDFAELDAEDSTAKPSATPFGNGFGGAQFGQR